MKNFQKKSLFTFFFFYFKYLFIHFIFWLKESTPLRNSPPHLRFIPPNFMKHPTPHFFQNFRNPMIPQKIGGRCLL